MSNYLLKIVEEETIGWAKKENLGFKYCLGVCYPVCGHISSGSEGSGELLEGSHLKRTLQG